MRRLSAALALSLLLLLAACARAPSLIQREAYVFGTRVEVSVWGESAEKAGQALAAVLAEFDRLHRMLHAWQPSELTALNAAIARGERDIAVSPELTFILRDAAAIAARSEQRFNPAIGKLVALWGFHSDEFKPQLPDAAALNDAVKARPRMSDLAIAEGRLSSSNRAVQLDLGGYAKGYALDRAAAILRGLGVQNALINIGGNVMALGDKGGQPWRVGIQHPRAATPLATLELRDGEAIGTSGDYQRYFELDGRRYCHLLDPRTGRPAEGTQAVTVLILPREGAGALSDAASKPLFIAAAGEWRGLARRLGVDHALRIDGAGAMHLTAALRERLSLLAADVRVEVEP
ncbi:MAG: FAD:protein FMN transferase [Zoogloeaceae bacterium]|nr:FAD:protein FMN transferase [Zoogloeaceae bacterium]MCK6384612.1 FAD:protein FMN transferase [Rhodocyclaceae bacterium]